ncbi:hypothetical protein FB451DRAFT_1057962 [Mycena latifolia]|nr:hypothetical protein FB451DRAFT_1057962 [Mycena latifolia]
MERQKGLGRGSYIYGTSVHNTRIERLWLDWTQGLGLKWHDFLMSLEHSYHLRHDNPAHIWLVHYLFLDAINVEAEAWVDAWNSHVMPVKRGEHRSPVDMFGFGLYEQGARGLQADEEIPPEGLASYGVDYQAYTNTRLMNHLRANNPQDWDNDNPFRPDATPAHRPYVKCEPPNSPFSAAELDLLDETLAAQVDLTSQDMAVRKLVWQEALAICGELAGN